MELAATPELDSSIDQRGVPKSSFVAAELARKFSPAILNIGFLFALLVAAACLCFSAIYLYKYLSVTSTAVDSIVREMRDQPGSMQIALSARLAVAKYSLSSCGVVTGLAFGFLGFALFLLGIQGTMDVSADGGIKSLHLAKVAPGTFVIVCAALLIGISITHTIDFSVTGQYQSVGSARPTVYVAPEVGHDPIP
jgi:small basic protein